MAEITPIVCSATNRQDFAYYFQLGNLDNASNFVNVWDQYRIDCVIFHIIPSQNALQVPTQSTTEFVNLYCVLDYDDNTALTTTAGYREYDNCIILSPGESCKRQFLPRIAISAYSTAFGAYANMGDVWIDTASTTVAHYGVKIGVPACDTSQTLLQEWKIELEYFISFRTLR
jgi:hypothetical protein